MVGDRKYSDKSDEYVVKVHGYEEDKTNETGHFQSVLLCPECLSDDVEITEEWHDQTYQECELYRLKYDKQFCRCKICQCKFERNSALWKEWKKYRIKELLQMVAGIIIVLGIGGLIGWFLLVIEPEVQRGFELWMESKNGG